MNFYDFIDKLKFQLQKPLPGEDAQLLMAPSIRRKMSTYNFDALNPKVSAVMALIYPNENLEPTMVLILRQSYAGVHSAQISFAGGKKDDADENIKATALRETFEEIGVEQHHINVLTELSNLYIPPSNFLVFPFLGYCNEKPAFNLDYKEVAQLIEFKALHITNDAIKSKMIIDKHPSGDNVTAPYYLINDHKVWGATAIILSEIEAIFKEILFDEK
jgi:8-oxo-dGTP pyrophosphatase MutT (NUDIX family)